MEEVVQVPLVMVQRKTAGLVVTVTAEVRELTVVIVAAPLTTLQVPVSPAAGALAAMVNVAVLHLV